MPPKCRPAIVAQGLVVVARDQHETHAFARLAQELLDHIVVRLRPMRPTPHLPEIDDVADEIDDVGFAVPQELEQLCGLRRACPQVDIGEEEGPHMPAEAEARWQVIAGFGHGRRSSSLKAVAGSAHGADRVGAPAEHQSFAQPADVYVDGALVHIHVIAPHAVEQLGAA